MRTRFEALIARARRDPAEAPKLMREILNEILVGISLLPTQEVKRGRFSLPRWTTEEGSDWIPVFTSVERLESVQTRSYTWFRMRGKDLLRTVGDDDVMINPSTDLQYALPREQVAWLLGDFGRAGLRIGFFTDEDKLEHVDAAKLPGEIRGPLLAYFETTPAIKSAFLVSVELRGQPGPRLHVVVDIDEGATRADVLGDIGTVIRNAASGAVYLTCNVLRRDDTPLRRFTEGKRPTLYERHLV